MAAVLSAIVTVIYWLAIIFGVVMFVLLGLGIAGSLNGGEISVPGAQAVTDDVPMGRLVAAMVGLIVFSTGIVYVCAQLRKILGTLADGDPFVPENAPRLTHIAIAIGLIEVIRNGAVLLLSATMDLGEGYRGGLGINLAAWGAVVVLLILAQVFKEGSRLREEQKMTI